MDLAEYFRLPSIHRLSRVDIADKLNRLCKSKNLDCTITPVSVGIWVSANKVPDNWVQLLEGVLNSAEQPHSLNVSINNTKINCGEL